MTCTSRPLLASFVVAFASAPSADAQTLLLDLTPEGPFGSIGEQVASAGDVDRDGVPDLLVAGRVGTFTFSGATGDELAFHDVDTWIDGMAPRNILGLPDVDGDGELDLAVASREEVRVYSRADGALLWTFSTPDDGGVGYNLALISDRDADGVDDLVVSEQYASPNGVTRAGSVHVLSATSGAPIDRIDGHATFQEIGGTLAVLGDVDGDGVDEIAFDDEDFAVRGTVFGRVVVMNPDDGALVRTIVSPVATFNFPTDLANGGDLDGDGIDDLVVGWFVNSASTFHLTAWAVDDGAQLWDVTGFSPDNLVNLGDVDGDGNDDLASGSPQSLPFGSSARVSSGADGSLLVGLSGGAGEFADLAACGDLDGDGFPELLSGHYPEGIGSPAPFARVTDLSDSHTIHLIENPAGGAGLGRAIDHSEDRDGDGVADWVLLGLDRTAHFSGATGELLAELSLNVLPASIFNAPSGLATLPDRNGDGLPEHVVGNGTWGTFALNFDGRVDVLSGADGAPLASRTGTLSEQLGTFVTRAHDEDGDGVPDLYVSAAWRDVSGKVDAGQVELVSGATLATLRTLPSTAQVQGHLGMSLSASADVDLDGVVDVAVGSDVEGPGQSNSGALYLHSGSDGTELVRVDGALDAITVRGAIVGDADADGIPDLLVAEGAYKGPGETNARGRVRLLSGATFATLWTITGDVEGEQLGQVAAGAGDVDGDGLGDVLASTSSNATGSGIKVLSGADGSLLDALDVDPDSTTNSVGGLGTAGLVDAGGCAEFAVGGPTLLNNGGLRLYSSSQGGNWGFVNLGHGLAGGDPVPPYLGITGDLQGGGTKSLAALRGPPNAISAWFLSVGQADVPFKGGILVPSPFVAFFVGVVPTDANGAVTFTAPTPLGLPAGVPVYHQWAFQDAMAPVGISLSNGLAEIFKGD